MTLTKAADTVTPLPPAEMLTQTTAPRFNRWLLATVIVLSVLVTFGQTAGFSFVVWDDTDNITKNDLMTSPSLETVRAFWTAPYAKLYLPVTYTVWSAIAAISPRDTSGQPAAWPFHLANVVVYTTVVLVVWRILARLFDNDFAAAIGALIFALHPLKAEPVSWVTGMKDCLSGVLVMTAIWQYLRFGATLRDTNPSKTPYVLATLCFVLAILSKPTVASGALIAFILAQWRYRPRVVTNIALLLPWCLLIVPVFLINRGDQESHAIAMWSPIWARPLIAADTIAFYLFKVIVPWPLMPVYGHTPESVRDSGMLYWTWLAPAALLAIGFFFRRRFTGLFVGLLVFYVFVLPASGITPFGHQIISTTADRYAFLSMFGVAIIAAGLMTRLPQSRGVGAAAIVIFVLLITTILQSRIWADSRALFQHNLAYLPNNSMVHYQLGAIAQEAGDMPTARKYFEEAVDLDPRNRLAQNNLAATLAEANDLDNAEKHYLTAVELDPGYAIAHLNLANVLMRKQQIDPAIQHYEAALRLDAASAKWWYLYANALVQANRATDAERALQSALDRQSNHPEAHNMMANLLGRRGDIAGAVGQWRKALQARPDWPEVANSLAYTLVMNPKAPQHDPAEPVDYAERAVRLTNRQAAIPLDTLAAAYTAAGRRQDALVTAKEALAVATAAGQAKLVQAIERRIAALQSLDSATTQPR